MHLQIAFSRNFYDLLPVIDHVYRHCQHFLRGISPAIYSVNLLSLVTVSREIFVFLVIAVSPVIASLVTVVVSLVIVVSRETS